MDLHCLSSSSGELVRKMLHWGMVVSFIKGRKMYRGLPQLHVQRVSCCRSYTYHCPGAYNFYRSLKIPNELTNYKMKPYLWLFLGRVPLGNWTECQMLLAGYKLLEDSGQSVKREMKWWIFQTDPPVHSDGKWDLHFKFYANTIYMIYADMLCFVLIKEKYQSILLLPYLPSVRYRKPGKYNIGYVCILVVVESFQLLLAYFHIII